MKEIFPFFFANANIIARAKALIINAFALTGRIVFDGFLPQGVALGYVLLPLRGVLLRVLHTLTQPSFTVDRVEGVSKIKQNGLKAQKAHSPRQRFGCTD